MKGRHVKHQRDRDPLEATGARSPRWVAAGLMLLALVLRLLFWKTTVDSSWPGSAYYKGDAWVWLDYATALERSQIFDLGVPIRAPGMAYLLDLVWHGGLPGLWQASWLWLGLGALAVTLFYLAARRAFGNRVGLLVGLLCAGSSGLMMLSTSLNNETPYLVLLSGIFLLSEGVARSARLPALIGWAVLNALACLFRVEHALFFLFALAWLVQSWKGSTGARASSRQVAIVICVFAIVLTPWHLKIWRQIDDLNHGPDRSSPATARLQDANDRALSHMTWQPEAARARTALPAFIRRPASNFVAATVAYRGRVEVTAHDFDLLQEAFGYVPKPLASHPFIISTGGLNFLLANHSASEGGFDPAPLGRPPPLRGGSGAYPASFVGGLPPSELAFSYPGHLRLVNEGYSLGWDWLYRHPGAALKLSAKKLAIFWRGATLGLTGWNLPLGAGGLRRPVDLVTPEGRWPTLWRWLILGGVGWGLVLAWQRPAARVWVLFLASKVIVAVLFYGYARQGATVVPVIALALAFVVTRMPVEERWLQRRVLRLAAIVALVLVAAEAGRFLAAPELSIDGRRVRSRDVPVPGDHAAHTIDWR